MQPAEDRIGTNRIGFSAAMARIWMRAVDVGGRRIRYALLERESAAVKAV
jgi:hypothetical protein